MGKVSDAKMCKGRDCGQQIRFIENVATGRKMPVNAEKSVVKPGDKGMIVTEEGKFIKDAPVGTVGYIPHWITCTDSAGFKKPAPIDTRRM